MSEPTLVSKLQRVMTHVQDTVWSGGNAREELLIVLKETHAAEADLAAARQRIEDLEVAGDALEKGVRTCKVRCRYIPMDELIALQRTWRRIRGG